MRKTTKGAIAVGAGVALLLGGAGTLAAWKVGAPAGAGTSVSSGTLAIAAKAGPTGTAAWSWTNGATPAYDATNSRIVPGDSVTRTQVFTVTARGEHLKFTGALDVTPALSGDTNLSTAVSTTTTLVATVAAPATITGSGTNTLTVTPGAGAADVVFDVTVTSVVAWPFGTTGSDTAATMAKSISLAGANLNLTQVTFP